MPEILLVQVIYWWSVLCFFYNNFSVWGGLFSYVCLLSMGRLSPYRIDKNQTFCLPISTYILPDFLASRFCKTTRRFSPFSCFQHDMFVWKIICWITLLIDTTPHSATDIPPFPFPFFAFYLFPLLILIWQVWFLILYVYIMCTLVRGRCLLLITRRFSSEIYFENYYFLSFSRQVRACPIYLFPRAVVVSVWFTSAGAFALHAVAVWRHICDVKLRSDVSTESHLGSWCGDRVLNVMAPISWD